MMDILLVVLGSSVVSAIITILFNWLQSRKNNELAHITEERKIWREKIRSIADGIKKSKYKGKGIEDIHTYLVQLQVNINPYGKTAKDDYLHDAHIWDTIERIQEAENKKSFKTHKKLLISYLSLMLKEDWERSKQEVKGYSLYMKISVIYIIELICIAGYYFWFLGLKDITMFFCFVVLSLLPVFIKYFFQDDIDKMKRDRRKILPISVIIKKEKKIYRKVVLGVVFIAPFFLIMEFLIFLSFTNLVIEDVECYSNKDNVYIYTELNEIMFPNIAKILGKEIDKEIIIRKNIEDIPELKNSKKSDNKILKTIIREELNLLNSIMILVCTVVYIWVTSLLILSSDRVDERKDKYKKEVRKLKYAVYEEYKSALPQSIEILEQIIGGNDSEIKSKKSDGLLGLEYKLLTDLKEFINDKTCNMNESVRTVEEFHKRELYKTSLATIKNCLKACKKLVRTKNAAKKRQILENMKILLEEMSQNLVLE